MSRKRDALSWGLVILFLGAMISAALYVLWPQIQPHTTVRIGDGVFITRVAKTAAARERGLSETQDIRQDQAMLLVYKEDGKWSVSMKDMKYSLDIVWLDKEKKVVYIVKNAQPEGYPQQDFTPKQDSRYVLELPAGTVSSKSIIVGKSAVFDENNLEGAWK